jgi:hypothetical protein
VWPNQYAESPEWANGGTVYLGLIAALALQADRDALLFLREPDS